MVIREAVPDDVGDLLRLVRDLASYERAADAVEATEADLRRDLFAPQPRVFALVAEEDGKVVGMAIYFVSFSTWTGRHGLYLEDLFVEPARRAKGIGTALLRALAAHAVAEGYTRLEWAVLHWNQTAIDFYRSLGAVSMDDWITFRLFGDPLTGLVERGAG